MVRVSPSQPTVRSSRARRPLRDRQHQFRATPTFAADPQEKEAKEKRRRKIRSRARRAASYPPMPRRERHPRLWSDRAMCRRSTLLGYRRDDKAPKTALHVAKKTDGHEPEDQGRRRQRRQMEREVRRRGPRRGRGQPSRLGVRVYGRGELLRAVRQGRGCHGPRAGQEVRRRRRFHLQRHVREAARYGRPPRHELVLGLQSVQVAKELSGLAILAVSSITGPRRSRTTS